jgi:shikimate dehydrogenase
LLISNRSLENAQSVMRDMNIRYPGTRIDVIDQFQVSDKELGSTALLLNTTSLGMNGERIENVNIAHLPEHAKVYDMVYSGSGTPLVKDASASGLRAVNGLGMLVAQGERAFEIWTGQKPPEGVMRKALDSV